MEPGFLYLSYLFVHEFLLQYVKLNFIWISHVKFLLKSNSCSFLIYFSLYFSRQDDNAKLDKMTLRFIYR